VIVHLEAPLAVIERRIDDYDRRGIANPPGQSLAEIFRERAPLYARHAEIMVAVGGLTQEEAARAVVAALDAPAGGDAT
jgi:shikimate kinase